jgi:hypothetical protein
MVVCVKEGLGVKEKNKGGMVEAVEGEDKRGMAQAGCRTSRRYA